MSHYRCKRREVKDIFDSYWSAWRRNYILKKTAFRHLSPTLIQLHTHPLYRLTSARNWNLTTLATAISISTWIPWGYSWSLTCKTDGTDIEAEDGNTIATVCNVLHSLFSSLSASLNEACYFARKQLALHILFWAVPQHAMEALEGRGGIAPSHS
jgi:hypothetical protein